VSERGWRIVLCRSSISCLEGRPAQRRATRVADRSTAGRTRAQHPHHQPQLLRQELGEPLVASSWLLPGTSTCRLSTVAHCAIDPAVRNPLPLDTGDALAEMLRHMGDLGDPSRRCGCSHAHGRTAS
jgi:hypothetical protein